MRIMKLKKFLLALFGAAMLPFTSCGGNNKNTTMETNDNKAVVCYFSATGTTEAAAKRIAKIAGADVHEIAPAVKYTSADLDWTDSLSRSYVEMHNRTFRPALKDSVTDLSEYSVVYIGYPNCFRHNINIHYPHKIIDLLHTDPTPGSILPPGLVVPHFLHYKYTDFCHWQRYTSSADQLSPFLLSQSLILPPLRTQRSPMPFPLHRTFLYIPLRSRTAVPLKN